MWEIDTAVEDSASYKHLGPHRWRASITGVITGSAEAATPYHCMSQLKKAVDSVLSRTLRGVGPFTYEGEGTTARLAPRLEKMLRVGAPKIAVSAIRKKPARSTKPKLAGIPR